MEPEELKVIAYAMDKMNVHIRHEEVLHELPTCEPHPRCIVKYNPLTNNDQMIEIINKIPLETRREGRLHCVRYVMEEGKSIWFFGETFNEAVCEAAYEYFKDK